MAPQEMRCSSCGKRIESEKTWVELKCPQCGKGVIIRCEKCKRLGITYQCPECAFAGP